MKKISYKGTAYRQAQDATAPWLVSIVAPAEEIYEWAGIPRRTNQSLTGFQRPDDEKRVEKTQKYFTAFSRNQSPTSLVLGIHQSTENPPPIELNFLGEDPIGKTHLPCELIVSVDEEETIEKVISSIREQINRRLTESNGNDDDADTGDTEDEFDSESIDNDDDVSDEIELGRSLIKDFLEKLDDPNWCVENESDLRDLAKPATVIDGQHRLLGARACERNIPFSVIAIFDCEWNEQVFQFTVVNYTAKGIPDQFITANAALSLTSDELDGLEKRLDQAGVKVIEYELMRIVNFDSTSAFFDQVNLATKPLNEKIGYKTMVKIAKLWYSGRDPAIRQIIDNIYPDLPGPKNLSNRLDRWKRDDWGEFFKDFWRVVSEFYAAEKANDGKSLWTVGSSSNLMIAVVLLQLQTAFLNNVGAQDESFFEVEPTDAVNEMKKKLRKRAQTFVQYFEPAFFAANWKQKSLNIGPGRDALNDAFRKFVDTKGKYQWQQSSLVTGKSGS